MRDRAIPLPEGIPRVSAHVAVRVALLFPFADCDAASSIRVVIRAGVPSPVQVATLAYLFASQPVWILHPACGLRRKRVGSRRNLYGFSIPCADCDAGASVCVVICMGVVSPVQITTPMGRFASHPVWIPRSMCGLRRWPTCLRRDLYGCGFSYAGCDVLQPVCVAICT